MKSLFVLRYLNQETAKELFGLRVKLPPVITGVARNFDFGTQNWKNLDIILVTFFSDVMVITLLK